MRTATVDSCPVRQPEPAAGLDAEKPLTLRRGDAARLVGVNLRTWDRMTAALANPAPLRIGRMPMWSREELLDWVRAGCPQRRQWEAVRKMAETEAKRARRR